MSKGKFDHILDSCKQVMAGREAEFKGSADGMFDEIGTLACMLMPTGCYDPGVKAAATLLALKLCRMKANPSHEDSAIDAINYLLFFNEMLRRNRP